jgi:hypothetical protein
MIVTYIICAKLACDAKLSTACYALQITRPIFSERFYFWSMTDCVTKSQPGARKKMFELPQVAQVCLIFKDDSLLFKLLK